MKAHLLKKYLPEFTVNFPPALSPMGWFFSKDKPASGTTIYPNRGVCMFSSLQEVSDGQAICFSKGAAGCGGASCYFGFTSPHPEAAHFLANKERFKEKLEYAERFYQQIEAKEPKEKYLLLSPLKNIADDVEVEVVNYWVTPAILAGLVTLANFDSPESDGVEIPSASGCQSVWTLPYKAEVNQSRKITVGAMDPAMRRYIPENIVVFSLSARRFLEMAENIKKSFCMGANWKNSIPFSPT